MARHSKAYMYIQFASNSLINTIWIQNVVEQISFIFEIACISDWGKNVFNEQCKADERLIFYEVFRKSTNKNAQQNTNAVFHT